MITLKVQHLLIEAPQKCHACARHFDTGSKMKVEVDDTQRVYLCSTCDDLIRRFRELFTDEEALICPAACIAKLLQEYEAEDPEQLLFLLTDVSQNTQRSA